MRMRAPQISSADRVPHDQRATKKPTNVTVNSDLLQKARELGINLSATLEEALVAQVRTRQQEIWLAENREAIAAYNEYVAKNGVFSDGARGF
jgi:antitoxin CcdA